MHSVKICILCVNLLKILIHYKKFTILVQDILIMHSNCWTNHDEATTTLTADWSTEWEACAHSLRRTFIIDTKNLILECVRIIFKRKIDLTLYLLRNQPGLIWVHGRLKMPHYKQSKLLTSKFFLNKINIGRHSTYRHLAPN